MTPAAALTAAETVGLADSVHETILHPRSRRLVSSPGRTPRPDAFALAPAALIADRYRIVRQLGRGGMGVVYLADDLRLDHQVALKFLPAALAADPRRLDQFHNEVRVARQISHPHVCRVFDIGDVDGHLFLSMEYVEGEDLSVLLQRRGALPEDEAVELTRQICAGLAAVHARGILHRDLKPANIMIGPGNHARLMDFGIASADAANDPERITEGTPAYMAPEQLTLRQVTVASDLYALGLVIYEIVTGRRATDAATVDELRRGQPDLSSRVARELAGVSPGLRQAIVGCLAPDPARRPASAAAVLGTLQRVLLDTRTRGRRILQVVTQALFIPAVVLGLLLLARGDGLSALGVALLLSAAVLAAVEIYSPLGWSLDYKGHRIRFQNHAILGERLYIDDELADRGRFGFRVTLRGTIEQGAGAGERITAHVRSDFHQTACRIVAESFAA